MAKRKDHQVEGVEISKSGIWILDKRDWYQVANFGLKLLYHITDSRGDVIWQIAIQTINDPDVYLELAHNEFATPAKFHSALLKKGFVFKGDAVELNLIKEKLISQSQHAQRVEVLGQHQSGLYFFANGAFDGAFLTPNEFHIIEHNTRSYYLPFASALHLKQYKTVSRFIYIEHKNMTIDRWMALYVDAYGKEEGLLPFCFYVASLFRDLAFTKTHFFPLLYLKGIRGSGKSSLARSLTALSGFPQAEINLLAPNTPKSLPRLLEQVSNALLWFDEYRNDLPPDIRALLQAAYDGGGYQKANLSQDNTTSSIDILSALILTSNFTPESDIFLSRCIVQNFASPHKTTQQKQAFDTLRELEAQGLSKITAAFLQHRAVIAEHWGKAYDALFRYFRKTTDALDNRILENLAVVCTPLHILATKKLFNLEQYFGKKDLKEFGREICLAQQGLLVGKSDLSAFFEMLSIGVESGRLTMGTDLTKTRHQSCPGMPVIALRLLRCVNFYQKEFRAVNNRIGLSKAEIETLLKQHPAFVADDVTINFQSGKEKRCPAKAMLLKLPVLVQNYGLTW